jgi:hypothetical protein
MHVAFGRIDVLADGGDVNEGTLASLVLQTRFVFDRVVADGGDRQTHSDSAGRGGLGQLDQKTA